jgi:hypothetical protein
MKQLEKLLLAAHRFNDAMQTTEDIAEALDRVSQKLKNGAEYGTILDLNGNKVGEWSL